MNALGWVEIHRGDMCGDPGTWVSSLIHQERPEVMHSTGIEPCGWLVCAVVPADEWDALTDVEAAVERAARARCHELGRTWDLLPDHMHDEWRRFVRPIVLAALGITP